MVHIELDSEICNFKDIIVEDFDSERLGSGFRSIRRELSFSRWCDDDNVVDGGGEERVVLDRQLGDEEDTVFELPFVQKNEVKERVLDRERFSFDKLQQERSVPINGASAMDDDSVYRRGNGSDKHVPFEIEERSERGTVGSGSYVLGGGVGSLDRGSENTVSVANILKTLFFVLVWYTFSLFLTLYNKSLLGDHMGRFPAPFLMNTIHFSMQAVLSKFITWFWAHKFETNVVMSWRDYFLRVVPTALGTAMDVNLSNVSLVFISVTFATMCKSAAPIFLLLFAFVFRLETPSFKLSGIILVISIGILLTVSKETEFEFWGFVLVMLAAVMSGFRWCMTQILLQKESYGLRNPLTLMSNVTPVMAVATALLSLALDPWEEFQENVYFDTPYHISRSCLLMFFGGTLAFFMVLTEYILVSVTSAVTVTIAGVVKEAVTILVAVLYFHDQFTWLKGFGLFTIMIGVSLFNLYKYQKLQKGHAGDNEAEHHTKDSSAKYVILEEIDEQDGGI